MRKRDFLKSSGALMAGSLVSQFASAQAETRENWAGNITYRTDRLLAPANIEEVSQLIKRSDKIRAIGSRHSFNRIADSSHNQITLAALNQTDIDSGSHSVTVGAAVKYGQLAPQIDAKGFALHNLASLPHISIAGAIATATHGSGLENGNLATAVRAVELITAKGEVVHLSRAKDGDAFLGAVVGLGMAGIVTRVTLDLCPAYQVAQVVYENLSFGELEHHLDKIFSAGYSVSLFTDWQHHRATQVWIKRRLDSGKNSSWPEEFYGAKRATEKLHPISGHPAESCTDQMGIPGPWYQRLPHFKMEFTPSSGRELQSEYLVPFENGYGAVLAVEKLRDRITPHLLVTELRTIAGDQLWMSTAYRRKSLAIHFTWKPEWETVKQILPQIEAQLRPFGPRPHWGKLFTLGPEPLRSEYVRLADFKALANRYDPAGKFRNEFIETNLYS